MNYHDWKSEQNPVRRMAKRLLSGDPLTDGRPLSDLIELDEHAWKCLAFEATLTDRQIDMLQELGYCRAAGGHILRRAGAGHPGRPADGAVFDYE